MVYCYVLLVSREQVNRFTLDVQNFSRQRCCWMEWWDLSGCTLIDMIDCGHWPVARRYLLTGHFFKLTKVAYSNRLEHVRTFYQICNVVVMLHFEAVLSRGQHFDLINPIQVAWLRVTSDQVWRELHSCACVCSFCELLLLLRNKLRETFSIRGGVLCLVYYCAGYLHCIFGGRHFKLLCVSSAHHLSTLWGPLLNV